MNSETVVNTVKYRYYPRCNLCEAAGINRRTVLRYLDLLARLHIIDELPAWTSNRLKRRSLAPKRFLVDPSLLASVTGATGQTAMRDGNLLGRLLETMVVAQLRAQATVSEQISRVPLVPSVAQDLNEVARIKGAQATTAIKGNTLNEDQVAGIYRGTHTAHRTLHPACGRPPASPPPELPLAEKSADCWLRPGPQLVQELTQQRSRSISNVRSGGRGLGLTPGYGLRPLTQKT